MRAAQFKKTIDDDFVRESPKAFASPASARREARRAMSNGRYIFLSGAISVLTFQGLWWMLGEYGDESPWVASSVGAGVALLACIVAREIRLRSGARKIARARHAHRSSSRFDSYQSKQRLGYTATLAAATTAIRRLERRLREIERGAATAADHLEASRLCEQYLSSAEDTLPTLGVGTEVRAAVRSGQERVRVLHKRHLLLWACKESRAILAAAQTRLRDEDKIETANAALAVIDKALEVYPDERDLKDSAQAVREFIASVGVAHWVKLAERAEFKGNREEAENHYRDALFDLSRADIGDEVREEVTRHVNCKLQLLQTPQDTENAALPFLPNIIEKPES